MKKFFKKIIDFILGLFKVVDNNIEEPNDPIDEIVDNIVIDEIEEPVIDDLEPKEEEIIEEPIIEQIEPKEPENNLETNQEEVYVMLTNRERQTYFKKLGFYTKKVDDIRGDGQKKAELQFNIIFLNKSEDTYTQETDKLLRVIYKSYCESPYMKDSDWQYFKSFQEKEFYCTCNKKYCDGWNGLRNKIPMHLLMVLQYIRNYYDKATKLTSTIRCKKRNAEVGGASGSKHMEFKAADNNAKGIKASAVVNLVYKGANKLPFVRYAYEITSNASHVDVTI